MLISAILFATIVLLNAETVRSDNGENGFRLVTSTAVETVLDVTINSYNREAVDILGESYQHISLPGEGCLQDRGKPELPVFNRSIIIPDRAGAELTIIKSSYIDVPMNASPSRGIIYRNTDPATVPYTFDAVYQRDAFYPGSPVQLSEPFILRDWRGITVQTTPLQYNPVTHTLRIYTHLRLKVSYSGWNSLNALNNPQRRIISSYDDIYRNFFLNYTPSRYTPVDEYGKLIVICPTTWMTTVSPYVIWKRQMGIATELVDLSTIGATSAALTAYIQNRYTADPDIAYIQLVGDAATMPTPSAAGGSSDPSYALVAGADSYPDIFIGRFSCESVTDLQTQINRSIAYERDITTGAAWLSRATGIASNEGGGTIGDNGESDQAHQEIIRANLMTYGYTPVDQMYQANGVTIANLSTAFNAGRGLINYVGHGSQTSWGTTGFSNTNVAALTNDNMLPLVVSVACVNGQFDGATCFAESWMRSQRSGNPIGSVVFWGSSINQSWNPPMLAQDEVNTLMINEQKKTVGSLLYNGACKMIDTYGTDGANMYKTWHIFGDASLRLRTKTPTAMTVTYPPQIMIGQTTLSVNAGVSGALVCLSGNNTIYGSGYTTSGGTVTLTLSGMPGTAGSLTLTVTAFNKVTHVGTVLLTSATGAYVSVDSITYSDSGNNAPDFNETGTLNVLYHNSGTAAAAALNSTLATTSAYVTITDNSQALPALNAGATYTAAGAFGMTLSNSVPDQTSLPFTISTVSGADSWQHSFSLVCSAPALALGDVTLTEVSGNGNGRFDPGETVNLVIAISNTGHAACAAGVVNLSCSTTGITVIENQKSYAAMLAGRNTVLTFRVQAAAGVAIGTLATFNFNALSGTYTAAKTAGINIGLTMEDFETANFNNYAWVSSGNANWTITGTGAYAGSYCARSGVITFSQSSSLQVGLNIPTASTISFYYKVSSESGYDYLNFYIDNVVQTSASWSGEVGWTQASYAVTAGIHTFKWTYSEDSVYSVGSDCAWLDNIVFPTGATAPIYPPQNLTAIAGNGIVNLAWQAPLSGSPSGYRVYRGGLSITPTPVTGLSFADNTVTNETSYTYYVTAIYPSGESSASTTATATPSANPLQVITIGTGAATQRFPLDRYYNYSSHECIYLATELGGAGSISKIAYEKASGTNVAAIASVSIYLKHTTAATLASGIYSLTGYTLVYSGSYPNTAASGWMEVTLSTPFAYNGTDNVSILVLKGNQAYITTGYPYWKYTAGTTRARQVYSDSSQPTSLTASTYIPNIRFTKQGNATPPVVQIPVAPVRMVAEFEPVQGALIRYPLGIPVTLVRELAEDDKLYTIVADASTQASAVAYYQANSVNLTNCEFVVAATDSYWTRDYGPWYIFDGNNDVKIIDFTYNRPRPNDDAIPTRIGQFFNTTVYPMTVSHTGGNMMNDGRGVAASTNLVLTENSSLTQTQLNTQMTTYLGVTDYQLYTDPNNTYIQHIDCWAKLLDVDKVLIRSVPTSHTQYSAIEAAVSSYASKTSSYGTPYRIYRVNTPNDEPYTNSYILNKKIMVPQMGTANDAAAMAAYRTAMPGYEIIGFVAGANAWASTDAIHCRVNSIPDSLMIHFRHVPLQSVLTHQPILINAEIAYHNPLMADSVRVFWKKRWNQTWRSSVISQQIGSNWQASLPELQYGDSLYYYLQAVDTSGRRISSPLCGGDDPFKLYASSNIELDIAISIEPVSGSLNIIWNPVAWANSYKIYSCDSADGSFTLVTTTTVNTWTHIISSGEPQKYYRVVASTD